MYVPSYCDMTYIASRTSMSNRSISTIVRRINLAARSYLRETEKKLVACVCARLLLEWKWGGCATDSTFPWRVRVNLYANVDDERC